MLHESPILGWPACVSQKGEQTTWGEEASPSEKDDGRYIARAFISQGASYECASPLVRRTVVRSRMHLRRRVPIGLPVAPRVVECNM